MDWCSAGEYAIQYKEWTISKALVDGIPLYTLWDGNIRIQTYPSAAAAQQYVAEDAKFKKHIGKK